LGAAEGLITASLKPLRAVILAFSPGRRDVMGCPLRRRRFLS
jgi:hypothetical protein